MTKWRPVQLLWAALGGRAQRYSSSKRLQSNEDALAHAGQASVASVLSKQACDASVTQQQHHHQLQQHWRQALQLQTAAALSTPHQTHARQLHTSALTAYSSFPKQHQSRSEIDEHWQEWKQQLQSSESNSRDEGRHADRPRRRLSHEGEPRPSRQGRSVLGVQSDAGGGVRQQSPSQKYLPQGFRKEDSRDWVLRLRHYERRQKKEAQQRVEEVEQGVQQGVQVQQEVQGGGNVGAAAQAPEGRKGGGRPGAAPAADWLNGPGAAPVAEWLHGEAPAVTMASVQASYLSAASPSGTSREAAAADFVFPDEPAGSRASAGAAEAAEAGHSSGRQGVEQAYDVLRARPSSSRGGAEAAEDQAQQRRHVGSSGWGLSRGQGTQQGQRGQGAQPWAPGPSPGRQSPGGLVPSVGKGQRANAARSPTFDPQLWRKRMPPEEYELHLRMKSCRTLLDLNQLLLDDSYALAWQNQGLLVQAAVLVRELAGASSGSTRARGRATMRQLHASEQKVVSNLQRLMRVVLRRGATSGSGSAGSSQHQQQHQQPQQQEQQQQGVAAPSLADLGQSADFCSRSLHSMARINAFDGLFLELLNHLALDNYQRLYLVQSRTLANMLWAVARAAEPTCCLRLPVEGLLQGMMPHLLAAVDKHLASGERQARWLAGVAWALGTLRHVDQQAVDATMRRLTDVAEIAMREQLVRRDKARARAAGMGDSAGLAAWSSQAHGDFNDIDVSGMCIGLARTRLYNERLMDVSGSLLLSMAEDGISPLSDQAWSNYIVSCAQLLHYNSKLMTQAAPHLAAIIRRPNTNPQVINNVIHAYAVFKHREDELLHAVAKATASRPHQMSGLDLSVIMWSLAVLGHSVDDAFIDATSERMLHVFETTDRVGRHRSNFAYGVLCLAPHRTDLLSKALKYCEASLQELVQSGKVETAQRYWQRHAKTYPKRTAGPEAGSTAGGAAGSAAGSTAEATGVSAAGSSAVAAAGGADDLELIAGQLDGDQDWKDDDSFVGTSEAEVASRVFAFCRVLYQVHQELADQGLPHLGLQGQALQLCSKFWFMLVERPTRSDVHDDVLRLLQALGMDVKREVRSDDGYFSTDILLQHPKWGRVALEVDGPFHFLVNRPDFHGKALLRNRFLARRFDRVVSLKIGEHWDELSELTRRQRLQELLELDNQERSSS